MDRFLIAPYGKGLQQNLEPWIIPDDAFAEMNNAYIWRGRIRKRFGSRYTIPTNEPQPQQLGSRLGIVLGTTDGAGNLAFPGLGMKIPGTIFQPGQMFSIGQAIYTVVTAGVNQPMLQTVPTVTATFDTTNGNYTFVGAPALTQVIFYPATPVMGFVQYQTGAIHTAPTFAFDQQFSYQFTVDGWQRFGNKVWSGTDSQFFWGITYRGSDSAMQQNLLFVTNDNPADGIAYWDGATWTTYKPAFNATPGNTIQAALIVTQFKDRLLLLNTIENNTVLGNGLNFRNRMRYSVNGDPTAANAFFDTPAAQFGGFLDNLGTQEAIISAQFIKDRLIVFFESSTWEIVYTGNEILPFRWQKLNTELGAESTFSSVPFDKAILTIGNVGVHSCNGVNVERIDEKIPDQVFEIHNSSVGVQRVFGIRDYFAEMVYWTFPEADTANIYPNQILTYNYQNATWAINDDSITAFGNFFSNVQGVIWESTMIPWQEDEDAWNDAQLQPQFPEIIAGNQEGFVFIVDIGVSVNAAALQITNMVSLGGNTVQLTIYNHNIYWINDEGIDNAIKLDGIVGTFSELNGGIYRVLQVIDANNITILAVHNPADTYLGGGTVQTVSNINILTKQFNPYIKDGVNVYIQKVDFLVNREVIESEIAVDYYASSSNQSALQGNNNSLLGTSTLDTGPYDPVLYPQEQTQDRLWHALYFQVNGDAIQFRIYFGNNQILTNSALVDFQLHALCLYTMPQGRLQ